MCLVAICWRAHPRYPLIIAANRDEFHARPSVAADWWDETAEVFGGRDLAAGGSWLAISRGGRFALVTNHPGRLRTAQQTASRGQLVRDFVIGSKPSGRFIDSVHARELRYAGFCLIAGTPLQVRGFVSPGTAPRNRWTLQAGVCALSNSSPDHPWPKAVWLEAEMKRLLDGPDVSEQDLLRTLARREPVIGHGALGLGSGDTGSERVLPEPGRHAHTPFVLGESYGTRASTAIMIDATQRCRFIERSFDNRGVLVSERIAEFRLS